MHLDRINEVNRMIWRTCSAWPLLLIFSHIKDMAGFLLQVWKIGQSFYFFYKYDLLQLWNTCSKFWSTICSHCVVMAVLVGYGWISATGMKNWSIFLLFFTDIIYYSYKTLVQNFEALHAVVVKLCQFWLNLDGLLLQVRKINQSF